MGNAAVIFICLAVLASAAWVMVRTDEAKDSRLLDEINYLKGKYKLLQKQVNEQNTKLYDTRKDFNESEMSYEKDMMAMKKEIRDLEYNVLKPRNINVTMMKPIEISSPDSKPIRVSAGLVTRKAVTRKKTRVAKKKATKKKSKKKSSKKSQSRSRGSK